MRNSPKRRETKRQELIDGLNEALNRPRTLENDVKKLMEALIFLLEEQQCQKKH